MPSQETLTLPEQLTKNLNGDKKGLPGWYAELNNPGLAESTIRALGPHLRTAYPKGTVTVIELGGGIGTHGLAVSESLFTRGLEPRLIVSDLQEGSLRHLPQEDRFPVLPVLSDSTKLPLTDGDKRRNSDEKRLVVSRAVEHYLPHEVQLGLVEEAGRVLQQGELYATQLSSGSPLALGALSEGLEEIAGKRVKYLSVEQYRKNVQSVVNEEGSPVFKEVSIEDAQAQNGRGALAQARRYLNDAFLERHKDTVGDRYDQYALEIQEMMEKRDELGDLVAGKKIDREVGVKELDATIQATTAFQFFREVYVTRIKEYLTSLGITPAVGMNLPGLRIVKENGHEDALLDVEYPIVVLEKRRSADKELLPEAVLYRK